MFDELVAGCPTWGVNLAATDGPICGPGVSWPVTVSLVADGAVPTGKPTGRHHIVENAQRFDVIHHSFGGFDGIWHERGRNWILWTPGRDHFAVTAGRHSGGDWVHVRFVLRHLIVSGLVAQPGWHCAHAAAVSLAAHPDAAVLIAGPYLSGKTVLAERIIAAGLGTAIVEDDCAVLDREWRVTGLMPLEHDVASAWRGRLHAIVCLDEQVSEVGPWDAVDVARLCAETQVSWPLSWLPGGHPRTPPGPPPAPVRCLRAPARHADQAVAALTAALAQT